MEINGRSNKSLPDYVSIIYLKKETDHMVSTEVSMDDIDAIANEIDSAINGIRSNNYSPKAGGHCMFCSYRDTICYKYNKSLEIRDTS